MSSDFDVFSSQSVRCVIWFCQKLGKSISQTKADLDAVYGSASPSLPTVSLWWHRAAEGRVDVGDNPRVGRPKDHENVDAIASYLQDQPFSSLRAIALALDIPKSTVENIVKCSLGLKHFNLRWVPHELSPYQKAERVRIARDLLATLEGMKRGDIAYLLTSDESWFLHYNPHPARWATSSEEAGQKARPTQTKEKCLIVVTWSFTGFLHVTVLPQGTTYTSEYVVSKLIPEVDAAVRVKRPMIGLSRSKLHWDNARSHTSAATRNELDARGVTVLAHPPYSPDLAPSDFFLFGHPKRQLLGTHFRSSDEIIGAIAEKFAQIQKETFSAVLEEWKHRLSTVVNGGGEYYMA